MFFVVRKRRVVVVVVAVSWVVTGAVVTGAVYGCRPLHNDA